MLPRRKRPSTIQGLTADQLKSLEFKIQSTLEAVDSIEAPAAPSLEQSLYLSGKLQYLAERVRRANYGILTKR